MRALQYLRSPSRIWAIEEGAWEEMVSIASGQNLTLDSIEASIGKLDNKTANAVNTVDGVAVIPVIGPIVKYGNLFSSISGATSVTKLTQDFTAALDDESVKSILFEIDSPGGEANGINEFAEQIYAARGTKPIQAYISGQGCSAAYWIASAVDEGGVFIDETAVAGSIGVAAVVKDSSGADEKDGIKTYKFVSEGSENKRPDLETDEGKSVVMESLNSMAHVFRSKVARNRSNEAASLTVRDVIEKFNRGGVLMGTQAVKAGLVDGISSKEEVLRNLIAANESTNDLSEQLQENIMGIKDENGTIDAAAVAALETEVTSLSTANQALAAEKEALAIQVQEFQTQLSELSGNLETTAQEKLRIQDENLTLKAEAKASELSGKMVPAQKDKFVANYIQNAKDDIANPVSGTSRLDNFLSMWEAAENHSLDSEELNPENLELSNDDGNNDDLASLLASATQFAQKENKIRA